MNRALEKLYFKWLCAKVMHVVYPTGMSLTYRKLLHILYTTEFVWLLVGDDNRVMDAQELRKHFILETDAPDDPEWRNIGCSVLEMMIAFSYRTEFDTGISAKTWFWEFIDNLGLTEHNDQDIEPVDVEDILDQFVWRTYDHNGNGGMFPMVSARKDQRQVEIWYQFCEYSEDLEL